MEYNREYWEPRIATKPNRFRKLNESNDYVELINEPEAISQAGTAFTAARMNNIEAGIEGVVAEVNEIQGVLDLTDEVPTFAGNASTATAPLYQWRKVEDDLYRYAEGESPTVTYYWYKVCKITTAMTFELELISDNNHPQRASYRLSVSAYSPSSAYTVALFNLGQAVAAEAKLAVAIDADGYLYIQTNAVWWCSLHVTLLYSVSSNFSITMDKLGYAPFGSASGFTPVKIITQTGGFRVANGVVTDEYSPIINTNIIGNLTGNSDTATKLATARKINGVSFDGSKDITVADSTKAPLASPAFTGSPTINGETVWHSGNDPFPNRAQGRNSIMLSDSRGQGSKAANTYLMGAHFEFAANSDIGQPDWNLYSVVLTLQPWMDGSGGGTSQLAFTQSGNIYKRYSADRTNWGEWAKIWNSGNDGSGSGLDADLLDGQHGSYYAPLESPALTGTPTAPTPATGTNNTQIATTAFVKNQGYEPNRGTGAYSTALGNHSEASGTNSTALGTNSEASGDYSTALGESSEASGNGSTALGENSKASVYYSTALGANSNASGDNSLALGAGAVATRDYQITIGTKFVYLRFPSNTTEATVYTALSPWINPTIGCNQGAMGSFGMNIINRLHRSDSVTIGLYNIGTNLKSIRSGNTTPIGQDFAICTVMY